MCDLGQIFQYQLTNFLFTYLLLLKLVLFSLPQKKRNIKLNHTVGILKEYRFYLLCYWHRFLAFSVELYFPFKLQILGTIAIRQGFSFQIRRIKL